MSTEEWEEMKRRVQEYRDSLSIWQKIKLWFTMDLMLELSCTIPGAVAEECWKAYVPVFTGWKKYSLLGRIVLPPIAIIICTIIFLIAFMCGVGITSGIQLIVWFFQVLRWVLQKLFLKTTT